MYDQKNTRELLRKYACQAILMQEEVARSLGLNSSDMQCYNILSSYGPMSPGELAYQSGFTTGAVTKILDRLEAHGAIRRVPVQDRRGLLVELLSPPTSRVARRPDINFDAYVQDLTARYTIEQLAIIDDFLEHGATAMQITTEKMRSARA